MATLTSIRDELIQRRTDYLTQSLNDPKINNLTKRTLLRFHNQAIGKIFQLSESAAAITELAQKTSQAANRNVFYVAIHDAEVPQGPLSPRTAAVISLLKKCTQYIKVHYDKKTEKSIQTFANDHEFNCINAIITLSQSILDIEELDSSIEDPRAFGEALTSFIRQNGMGIRLS